MSEHWDVYFGFIDEDPSIVVLDMMVHEEIDKGIFKYAYCLRLTVKEPNEDGFPVDPEAEHLNAVAENVIESVEKKNFVYVGRVTTKGQRDEIFYTSEPTEHALREAANRLVATAGYEFEVFPIQEEQNWDFYYEFLYPNIYQQQQMANRHVVEALENDGDPLTEPRKVEHWVYFDDINLRRSFIKKVVDKGFVIEEQTNEMDEDGRFMVRLSRVDLVDYESIDQVTYELVEWAEEYEGDYDGWETSVIKAEKKSKNFLKSIFKR